jgi:DNA-binding response OmpR family regulator
MTKKILIVDDDPDMRSLYRLVLRQEGLEVIEAETGSEALSLAKKEPLALVLLDIMMPEMDGYEVCRRLRADPRTADLPVLMFSANGTGSARRNGMLVGANDFVTKSVGPRALVARVRSILSSPFNGQGKAPFPVTGT